MDSNQIISNAQTKFNEALERFRENLKGLRTGRASADMLDSVTVEAYGTPMPLKQLASIAAPEAQLLQITPFDPNNLTAIAAAIRENQSLGLNPNDDGRVVRIPIPPLTEERRRDLAKQIGQKQEEAMVRLRGVRHEALDAIDKLKKDKQIGEDDAKRLGAQVETELGKVRADVEAAAKAKEADILTI